MIFRKEIFDHRDNLDEVYRRLETSFSPQDAIKGVLWELFKKNQDIELNGMNWMRDLVIPEEKGMLASTFPVDLTKGNAKIITGESGSGKSWFAKHWLPHKHPDASFIYHELTDEDAEKFGNFGAQSEHLAEAYKTVMRLLMVNGNNATRVYSAVSELSRLNNKSRNEAAVELFEEIIQKTLHMNATASEWWERPRHTLEKLVIILDEMGKKPDFARAIVDQVRHISIDICRRKLAKNVMIVLVGSGLDYFIKEDGLDSYLEADPSERIYYRHFGTDPMKSSVTILKGPDLEKQCEICNIPIKDIKRGTFSQVLATNTRMLMRGIVPILNSGFNTLRVDNLSSRRVELGSTNVVMDYAARVYIDLNGLARIHEKDRSDFETLLLRQFQLLVFKYRSACGQTVPPNPASTTLFDVSHRDYETVLKMGLITSNITGTSRALKYLACKGQTAPLFAQDGAAFELVLQHHLVRLCKAEYEEEDKAYYCDRYELKQAWPPSPTKNEGLNTEEEVKTEINQRYSSEQTVNRLASDVDEIASLVAGKANYDLVLRQTVGNAQGADVMVLRNRKQEKEATLDLYQAKHYKKFPSRSSKETIRAFASLGVRYDAGMIETRPTTGSEAYSYVGTLKFAQSLSSKLGIPVSIGKRIVVFSGAWNSLLECRSWNEFRFEEAAKENNVWIWTREMVEPTISALITKSPNDACAEE